MKMFDDLKASGVDLMFDIYHECLGTTSIPVILPAWYQGMDPKQRKSLISRLKLAVIKASEILLGFTFNDILVAYMGPGLEKDEGNSDFFEDKTFKNNEAPQK